MGIVILDFKENCAQDGYAAYEIVVKTKSICLKTFHWMTNITKKYYPSRAHAKTAALENSIKERRREGKELIKQAQRL